MSWPRKEYGSQPPAIVGGRPPRGTAVLLGVLGGFFLIFVVSSSEQLAYWTALRADLAFAGFEIWRLVTSLIFFGFPQRVEVLPVLGGGAVVWLLGSLLERWWGTFRLVVFFLVSGCIGNLVGALFAWAIWPWLPVGGFAAGAAGLATAVGVIFLRAPVGMRVRGRVFAVKGWHILAIMGAMFGLGMIVDLIEGRPVARYFSYLGGCGVALLFISDRWRPWVAWRQRRSKRLADKYGVTVFPDRGRKGGRSGRKDPYRWN